jgi:hypothetical protein
MIACPTIHPTESNQINTGRGQAETRECQRLQSVSFREKFMTRAWEQAPIISTMDNKHNENMKCGLGEPHGVLLVYYYLKKIRRYEVVVEIAITTSRTNVTSSLGLSLIAPSIP